MHFLTNNKQRCVFIVQWYKGAKDITNAGRTIKEVFNDYVRFSIKESKENDSGIYFITARNKHGVDRSFCQVTVSLILQYFEILYLIYNNYLLKISLNA